MPLPEPHRLNAKEVRYREDLSRLGIESSTDLSPSPTTVGQPEALAALEIGITMRQPGYNVFLSGSTGTGRFASIRMMIDRVVRKCRLAPSYSYVHNFDDPDRPMLIALPRGLGRNFRTMLDKLRADLGEEIPGILHNEVITRNRERILEEFKKNSATLFAPFEAQVQEEGFQVVQGADPGGHVQVTDLYPVVDGQPVPIEETAPAADASNETQERHQTLLSRHAELKVDLRKLMLRHRDLRSRFQELFQQQQRQHAQDSIRPLFDHVRQEFEKHEPRVAEFLDNALAEILENLPLFLDNAPEGSPEQAQNRAHADGLLYLLRSNMITEPPENGSDLTSPVVEETFPTYRNLFGTIEMGGEPSATTFLEVKGGSLLQADGGYLVLSARDVVNEPKVYETLKRTLRKGELEITPREDGVAAQLGLKPQPIPVDVKVILVGEPMTYEILHASDPDFRKIFKVKAEFDDSMPLNDETLQSYLSVLRRIQNADDLPDFDRSALEALVEEGVGMSGTRDRLTTRFSDLADIMREAAHLSQKKDTPLVGRAATDKAINNRYLRHNLAERKLHEHIASGKLLTEVEGECVGQINGLAYYSVDHADFGTALRITGTTAIGREDIVNIEREAELSGSIHDKGVLLLSGFLAETFAQDKPLCLHANIAMEQSYVTIDGDSASLGELLVLLSSLSGHALRQDLAITGSLNQHGKVQPVGGVTEKIEGFYRTCKILGLNSNQGVVLPAQNTIDLHLSEELTQRIDNGDFSIYSVIDYRQALQLMTGRPFQETLDAADAKLEHYAAVVRRFGHGE